MNLRNGLSLRPTKKLLRIVLTLCCSGLVIGVLRLWSNDALITTIVSILWLITSLIIILVTIIDVFSKPKADDVSIHRSLPKSFSLNSSHKISVSVQNNTQRKLNIIYSESLPSQVYEFFSPIAFELQPYTKKNIQYMIKPQQRGQATFEAAWLQVSSTLGLWNAILRVGDRESVKVLPNFSAITTSFSLGIEKAMRHIGANISNQSGEAMEFKQLREFRQGDTLKQIDWKATARIGEPISREYQEEKDQNIIFLLDCSRRMRAKEKHLSYFDYALQALLICSYIALDKGDAVGVMNFSGEPGWLPPIKGKTRINSIINHLYQLSTSPQSTDYIQAAEELLRQHRKRSLIILLTNVQSEDSEDLQYAIKILRRYHVVLVATIQENAIVNAEKMQIQKEDDALLYAGIKQYDKNRKRLLRKLSSKGIPIVDASYKNLHQRLVNEYLTLKRMGKI